MDDASNPYTPGIGRTPAVLAGRDSERELARVMIQRTRNRLTTRPMMLWGRRGVGKTVLLRDVRHMCDQAGWMTLGIEAGAEEGIQLQVRQRLEREMVAAARRLWSRHEKATGLVRQALETVSSFSMSAGTSGFSLGVDIDRARGRADSGSLSMDLEEVIEDMSPALIEQGVGFAIFVDEIQDLDRETTEALLMAHHRATQENWPFHLVGAGLPTTPAYLASVRPYAERQFEFRAIDRLPEPAAHEALRGPATAHGVTYTQEALTRLSEAAGGYPYFIQEYGMWAWRYAPGPSEITATDAEQARIAGTEALDEGFFRSRWERATRGEQKFMAAMAVDEDRASSLGDLVARLGKRKPSDLSRQRQDLMTKGLIYATARGELAFTVPMMADFIVRVHPD